MNAGDHRGADISPCDLYRYRLWRWWDKSLPLCGWIMLNPSTADADLDDPTIRRCIGYARAWGYGGIMVTNLFALRATNPDELKVAADPVGPDNDEFLLTEARACALTVAGWGTKGELHGRAAEVCRRLRVYGVQLHALRVTKDGHPSHPLYLPKALKPVSWSRF